MELLDKISKRVYHLKCNPFYLFVADGYRNLLATNQEVFVSINHMCELTTFQQIAMLTGSFILGALALAGLLIVGIGIWIAIAENLIAD